MRATVLAVGVALVVVAGWRLRVTGRHGGRPSGRWFVVLLACACCVAVAATW